MKPSITDVNIIPGIQDKYKKVFCPICILSEREIPMIYDEKQKTWICNKCQYLIIDRLNPVSDVKLEAGAGESNDPPYCKSVSFKRTIKIKPDTEVYNNPADAWNEM